MDQKFAMTLLDWHRNTPQRPMPWRGETDAYLVWLSEVILQQTRVEQGLPYFNAFKAKYQTVNDLAAAPSDEVMHLWQGLGYYSRARNLHYTAKYIATELKGVFPSTYRELLLLKGVGAYTAAAIASFVYGERQAVVDGNVIRVLARVYGIDTPFDTTEGKKQFAALAHSLIPARDPGQYNQAIMDFGATHCTPMQPLCTSCPFDKRCLAKRDGLQSLLPIKVKKLVKKIRYFYYLLIRTDTQIVVQKRGEGDIWEGLYELPMIESDTPIKRGIQKKINEYLGNESAIIGYSRPARQQLTHQTINSIMIEVASENMEEGIKNNAGGNSERQWVSLREIHQLGFPKQLRLFLKEKSLL